MFESKLLGDFVEEPPGRDEHDGWPSGRVKREQGDGGRIERGRKT